MTSSTDANKALRFLRGLEDGGVAVADSQILAQDLDPVLVHVVVRYLREAYPASNPAASAVLERLTKLTTSYPGLVAKAKEGEQDSVAVWFAATYSFRDFRGRGPELIEIVVDKLES